jgi:hypothetical protein
MTSSKEKISSSEESKITCCKLKGQKCYQPLNVLKNGFMNRSDISISFSILMLAIWASKLLDLQVLAKICGLEKLLSFLLRTLLTVLYLLIYFIRLSVMQEIKSLQDVKSILPIPDEVARKFIRDKGLKNIALAGGGILGSESGSSSGLGNLNELLSKDSAAAAATVPAVSGDEAVKTASSLAANSAGGHRRRHKEGGHHDKNDNHRAKKGLQRILDLFGIKSLDQITSVVPIENIKEVPAAAASALLSGGSGGAAKAVVPKIAADEAAGGSTVAEKAAADPLAPIQESLARENKASDMLSAALKQHGEKIKAIERVKRLHDVRRAEAIKRLEEVKQLLEVRQRKYKMKKTILKFFGS